MIESLIAMLCLQMNQIPDASKYYTSCIKASSAASLQVGLSPMINNFEAKVSKDIQKETGDHIWWLVGAFYAYQQKGLINLNINAKPYADNINFTGNPNDSNINIGLSWYF